MNLYISRNYKGTSSAGNKAKTDMEAFMHRWGYRNIGLQTTYYNNKITDFLLNLLGVIKACLSVRRGDIVFLQYPLKKYFTFICCVAHIKGARVAVLIHDLGSFRRKRLTITQEIDRLNNVDYVIATNERMRQWLAAQNYQKPTGVLGLWDYISTTQSDFERPIHTPYRMVYAGTLGERKSAFLYNIGQYLTQTDLLLYGGGLNINKIAHPKHLHYMGFKPAETLINTIEGEFGLVWDGDSLTSCTGAFGEYLRYNTPHKTSLYIKCGLPIIIWRKAALASFVDSEQIGICIDSLTDIETILSRITIDQYRMMKDNVRAMNDKISNGYFFKNATDIAIETLQGNGV